MFDLAFKLMSVALVGAEPANPLDVSIELVKPEVAAARVAACELKTVRPKFDNTLQEDVIEVTDVTSASEEQIRCAVLASLDTKYYVVFLSPMEKNYQSLYWQMSRERGKADARAWLEKRGLLSRLPTYDPARSNDAAFVRALEALCGPKAAGSLKSMSGMATFKTGAPPSGKLENETFWCLINAATASGYPFGFIGNEAYGEDH